MKTEQEIRKIKDKVNKRIFEIHRENNGELKDYDLLCKIASFLEELEKQKNKTVIKFQLSNITNLPRRKYDKRVISYRNGYRDALRWVLE